MTVSSRWTVDVTCPCCGGDLVDQPRQDPSGSVRRRTLTCPVCDRSWTLTVTLCPERLR